MRVTVALTFAALVGLTLASPASAIGPYCGSWCSSYPSSQVCYCYPSGLRTTCGSWPCACKQGFPCQAEDGSPLPQEPVEPADRAALQGTVEMSTSLAVAPAFTIETAAAASAATPEAGCYVETDCAGCCPTLYCSGTYCSAGPSFVECDGHRTSCPKNQASCC